MPEAGAGSQWWECLWSPILGVALIQHTNITKAQKHKYNSEVFRQQVTLDFSSFLYLFVGGSCGRRLYAAKLKVLAWT